MTDDEQRRLDLISRSMQRDDPALERALSSGRLRNRRRYAIGSTTSVVAMVGLFVALCLGQGLSILAAWILFAVGVVVRILAD